MFNLKEICLFLQGNTFCHKWPSYFSANDAVYIITCYIIRLLVEVDASVYEQHFVFVVGESKASFNNYFYTVDSSGSQLRVWAPSEVNLCLFVCLVGWLFFFTSTFYQKFQFSSLLQYFNIHLPFKLFFLFHCTAESAAQQS